MRKNDILKPEKYTFSLVKGGLLVDLPYLLQWRALIHKHMILLQINGIFGMTKIQRQ